MNEIEAKEFEAELRKIKPAQAPDPLLRRLEGARKCSFHPESRPPEGSVSWNLLLRWLGAGTATAMAVFFAWRLGWKPPGWGVRADSKPAATLKADGVEVDQKLVSSFDAVAQLPGGQPVRFRVQNWMDHVVVSDKDRGLVIDHSNPRVEVVPVRFETY
ncbi:hypothetical protein SBV1_1510004 [Verrucomicrobia bacterium]|nr:hypothetical protein SBV1_1510004 [Verrucomicrobiota bacterium]